MEKHTESRGQMQMAMERGAGQAELCELLWESLRDMEGRTFVTMRGLTFTYEIRGGEMFISRKEKSITRASVEMAFQRALEVEAAEGWVRGPKRLGTFGASYLLPVFIALGICRGESPEKQQKMVF